MRLLITGASGLLGLNLAVQASQLHEVMGVDRNTLASAPFRVIQADLLDDQACDLVIKETQPEAVIHCAAIADVDACEKDPELARRTNADLPRAVAEACARRNVRLIHVSTDAVFSGWKSGPYSEGDKPDPQGAYARTKLEGENAVLRANPRVTVARVNFYGWSLSGRRSLAEFFVNHLTRGATINGFTDVTFCPMFVGHLSGLLLEMLSHDLRGIYHVVGSQAMTKYQFGVEIARKFGLPERLISPQSVDKSSLAARRSHNLWLSTHKISTALRQEIPDFSTGLDMFHAQYLQGYPQRIRGYPQAASTEIPDA